MTGIEFWTMYPKHEYDKGGWL